MRNVTAIARVPSATVLLDRRSGRGKSLRVADTWDILDALALESVGDADSNGIELSRVLGLIDYVNRTVLNHDETERTLRRLLGSGLAVETLDGFRRTTAGQDLHARCPSKFPLDRARWIESQPHGHGHQVVCDHRAVEEAM
jgi:hypothetical protein